MKHTQEPWNMSNSEDEIVYEIFSQNHIIAEVFPRTGKHLIPGECKANAMLIVSSPNLLSGMKRIRDILTKKLISPEDISEIYQIALSNIKNSTEE